MQDEEFKRREAWINTIRAMHRNKRRLGYLVCALGIGMVLWGRFATGAPAWSIPVGIGIIFAAWILFVYVLWDRWRWAKSNDPTKPHVDHGRDLSQ